MEVEYYAEFSRKWHIAIGSQLIVNFALSLILMPHSYLLMYWIRKRYRERRQSLRSILA